MAHLERGHRRRRSSMGRSTASLVLLVTALTVAGRGGVPVDAEAVVLNVTVTEALGPGFVTVYPCGSERPTASNLNYVVGSTMPNAVIAKVGANGQVCLYTLAPVHLIVDVNGYFP